MLSLSTGFGQEPSTVKLEERTKELNKKAKWVEVIRDLNDVPYFVDAAMMDRIQDTVVFRTKMERRGTIKYQTFLGGCDDNRLMMTSGFAVYPSSSDLWPLDSKDKIVTAEKGSVGARLLDYVCENAKVTVIKNAETSDVSGGGTRNLPPKTILGGVLNGKAVSLPRPPYPPAARAVRASGTVSVKVLIDESGDVVSASAVSGHPLLQAAAVQAARSAKFSPMKLSGQPVKVSGVITYNFVP